MKFRYNKDIPNQAINVVRQECSLLALLYAQHEGTAIIRNVGKCRNDVASQKALIFSKNCPQNLELTNVFLLLLLALQPTVLAFSVILFHSALSSGCFLHRLIPIICISSSMTRIHLFLDLSNIIYSKQTITYKIPLN